MQRREFITLLGGAAVALPLTARAQQPAKLPTIGFLGASTSSAWSDWTAAFVQQLRELVRPVTVAVLTNPDNPSSHVEMEDLQSAAKIYDQRLLVLNATSEPDINSAFTTLQEQQAGGLLVQSNPLFTSQREKIVMLAAHHAVPTIYAQREFADIGGLMSYGVSFPDVYRQLGVYTGKILKGEKPANLPVLQPTKFEFIINLKTVKTLGLTIPSGVLTIADEVIE
jgi:putative ABC transport system substrate-binding protein